MKKYYWEIYELMGDPSLLPWAGRASDLPISLVNDGNTITITTAPNTYLAILDTATLLPLFAGHADQQGLFEIPSSAISDINHTLLSATCQHYKPYFRLFANDPLGIDSQLSIIDSQLSLHPNPAFDHVTLSGLPSESTVQIFDAQGRLQLTQSHCHSATMSVDISMMMSGIYIFRIITPQGILTRKLIKK
jgi:hypothetical protein